MSFTQDIANWSAKSSAKAQSVRRGVALKLFGAVVLDTPVLTGRARGNWRFSIGAANTDTIDRVDPSGQIVMQEIVTGVAQSTGDVSVTLANGLPYIERLENGYSDKAPEGMVRKNVTRFQQLVQAEVQSK